MPKLIPMTTQLKKYSFILLSFWLGAGMLSLAWNIYDDQQEHKVLPCRLPTPFSHNSRTPEPGCLTTNGVYVPVTKKPINPVHSLNDDPRT